MRGLYNNSVSELSLHLQALTAAANGDAIIDMLGYERAMIIVMAGTITDGTSYEFELKEGDAANLSDAAAVGAADLIGSEPTFLAANDDTDACFEYIGSKRYIRLDLKTVVGSPSTGGVFGAIVVKYNYRHKPAVAAA